MSGCHQSDTPMDQRAVQRMGVRGAEFDPVLYGAYMKGGKGAYMGGDEPLQRLSHIFIRTSDEYIFQADNS